MSLAVVVPRSLHCTQTAPARFAAGNALARRRGRPGFRCHASADSADPPSADAEARVVDPEACKVTPRPHRQGQELCGRQHAHWPDAPPSAWRVGQRPRPCPLFYTPCALRCDGTVQPLTGSGSLLVVGGLQRAKSKLWAAVSTTKRGLDANALARSEVEEAQVYARSSLSPRASNFDNRRRGG